MKTLLRSLSIALAIGTTHAAVIFDIGDVVRPGGSGTANTVIFGTGLTSPNVASSMIVTGTTPTSVAFSSKGGFFMTYFDLQTLAIGDTLQVDYTVTFQNANGAARGLRIGMFNSDTGTIFTSDQSSTQPAGFANAYPGYFQTQRITSTSSDDSEVVRRNTINLSPLGGTGGVDLGDPTGLNATNGTPYDGVFSITRTGASDIRLDSQFGTQTALSFTDTGTTNTAYNVIGFQLTNTIISPETATTMTFSKFNISVVPEPTTVTLLFSSLAVGVFVLGRHRRARFSES